MTPHEMDSRFAAEIARMKKLTIEKNRQDGRWLLSTAVAGVVVGVTTWFGLGELGPSFAAGMLVFMIGIVIWRVLTDPETPVPNCPRCNYCWGIGESADEWLKWKCCPSCGLKVEHGAEVEERTIGDIERRNRPSVDNRTL